MSHASLMPAAPAANVCNECQGLFPTPESLGTHLLWHNQLRAHQAAATTAAPPPAPVHALVATNTPVHPTGSSVAGIVDHYDNARGFGFIRRSAPGAPSGQVYFHRDVVASGTALPLKRGDAVAFIEQFHHKRGARATTVRAASLPHAIHGSATTRPATAVEADDATVKGIVAAYTVEGGFGTITKLDGSPAPNVYFTIHVCDMKRPPLTVGERVMIRETVGPKGPTAALVRRTTIAVEPDPLPTQAPTPSAKKTKAKTKTRTKTKAAPPMLSNELILTALTRAMYMVVNSPRAGDASPMARQASNAGRGATHPRAESAALTPKQYQAMIESLSSQGGGGALNVPAGIAMLYRTRPFEASTIEATDDRETQAMLLIIELGNELDQSQRRVLLERAERSGDDQYASLLDFGFTAVPSPVARQPEPAPEPEQPSTLYCGICMDDDPIEDIFVVSGCDHTYCRESIHTYIMGRINEQDVMPVCPHDGCKNVISDGDLTMVLTIEETENYYKTCQDLAIANEPGLFQCLQENCRGIGALPPDDPRFVCPVCRAERCVQCNTREWHTGMTCEQLRQREKDNELHPQQLRQIYGTSTVYQCGRCSFGPIERMNCGDLRAHHNEAVGNARVNNGCPRCHWFANDISQWPRWNGHLHAALPPAQA